MKTNQILEELRKIGNDVCNLQLRIDSLIEQIEGENQETIVFGMHTKGENKR